MLCRMAATAEPDRSVRAALRMQRAVATSLSHAECSDAMMAPKNLVEYSNRWCVRNRMLTDNYASIKMFLGNLSSQCQLSCSVFQSGLVTLSGTA
jgi:hypothetical protein